MISEQKKRYSYRHLCEYNLVQKYVSKVESLAAVDICGRYLSQLAGLVVCLAYMRVFKPMNVRVWAVSIPRRKQS